MSFNMARVVWCGVVWCVVFSIENGDNAIKAT